MGRVEENKKMREEVYEQLMDESTRLDMTMHATSMQAINGMAIARYLLDISISLATIADALTNEEE